MISSPQLLLHNYNPHIILGKYKKNRNIHIDKFQSYASIYEVTRFTSVTTTPYAMTRRVNRLVSPLMRKANGRVNLLATATLAKHSDVLVWIWTKTESTRGVAKGGAGAVRPWRGPLFWGWHCKDCIETKMVLMSGHYSQLKEVFDFE